MEISKEKIPFGVLEGLIVAGTSVIAIITTGRMIKAKLELKDKENEVKILKSEISKLQDFLEWDLDYMEDKINLNMIELTGASIRHFADKELIEIKEQTKKYTETELLNSIRERIQEIRKLVKEN